MPRHHNAERRASDASAPGLSMEARMTRIESMMEALLHERTVYTSPRRSTEHENPGSNMALSMPMLDLMTPTLAISDQSTHVSHPQDVIDPLLGTNMSTLHLGGQDLAFPGSATYEDCISIFFSELQMFHPCIDEQLFRDRSQQMLAGSEVLSNDVCFLALNYIIFALHAVSTEAMRPEYDGKPVGWHWLQLADDVVAERQLSGRGDISLAQFLVFKVGGAVVADDFS